MAKEIRLKFDDGRAGEIEDQLTALGLKTYQELFLRLWDTAGTRLQRDGSLSPSMSAGTVPPD